MNINNEATIHYASKRSLFKPVYQALLELIRLFKLVCYIMPYTVIPLFYNPLFKTTLDYKSASFGLKGQFSVLNDLYFKTTCSILDHRVLVPWVVLK